MTANGILLLINECLTQSTSEKLLPASDSSRCRDPDITLMRSPCSVNNDRHYMEREFLKYKTLHGISSNSSPQNKGNPGVGKTQRVAEQRR